jgi:hypothetical protein
MGKKLLNHEDHEGHEVFILHALHGLHGNFSLVPALPGKDYAVGDLNVISQPRAEKSLQRWLIDTHFRDFSLLRRSK